MGECKTIRGSSENWTLNLPSDYNDCPAEAKSNHPNLSLLTASLSDNRESVQSFLSISSTCDPSESQILHCAVASGSFEIVERILELHPDVNSRDSEDRTPLHLAAEIGSEAIARALLERGANVEVRNRGGEGVLHLACKAAKENVALVELLLNEVIHVDEADEWGATPLHAACERNRKATVKLLVKHGANVNAQTKRNESPLYLSVNKGSPELIKFLLSRGAEVNGKSVYGETALHTACRYHSDVKIRLLLEHGADVDVTDDLDLTPFFWMNYKSFEAGRSMIRHMAKLTGAGRVNARDLKIIDDDENLSSFYEDCLSEIEGMREERLRKGLSVYDLMLKRIDEVACLVKDEGFVGSCESRDFDRLFPTYASELRSKLAMAKRRRDALYRMESSLHSIFWSYLPFVALEVIAKYLTDDD